MSPRWRRVRIWAVIAVTAVIGLGLLIWRLAMETPPKVDEGKLRAELAQALPTGSNPATVASYLDARRVEHSTFSTDGQYILAIWRDVSHSWLVSESLQARFDFKNEKLVRITVRPVFTGP